MRADGAVSTPGWPYGRTLASYLLSVGDLGTWPPEKPTATTPSSLPRDKNLGCTVDGEVMSSIESGSPNSSAGFQ